MIKIFTSTDELRGVIQPTSATIYQAINDEYSCEITVPIAKETHIAPTNLMKTKGAEDLTVRDGARLKAIAHARGKGQITVYQADGEKTRVYSVAVDSDEFEQVKTGGEVVAGRNLFSDQNYSHHSNAGYRPMQWTSAIVEITPSNVYTLSYVVTDTNRFGVWQDPLEDGLYAQMTSQFELIAYRPTLVGEEITETVTTWLSEGNYLVIYLANTGNDKKERFKAEAGTSPTVWTPAHEDIDGNVRVEVTGDVEIDSISLYDLDERVMTSTGYELIQRDAIVELPDANGTKQKFRLETPEQTLDTVTAFGWHITQDLAKDQIVNTGWVDRAGSYVWPLLVQSGISERRFTGMSNIETVNSLSLVRRSVLAGAIGTQDNSFVNRFGGEMERDNFTVNMKKRLGADKGYRIEYRKNLMGFNARADDSQIVNRVIPTYLNALDAAVTLPEVYIDSPRITDTAVPHAQSMHFGDIRVGFEDAEGLILYPDTTTAENAVRSRVSAMFESGIDRPQVTVDVNFIDLRKTQEYAAYQELETLLIGDSVTLLYDKWTVRDRLIAYKWDALNEEYLELKLGRLEPSMDALTAKITTEIQENADAVWREQHVPHIAEHLAKLNYSIANAAGVFTTVIKNADGSEFTYYHDRENLEDSLVIEYYPEPGSRVWTNTGWNEGNPTWLYGNDNHGHLVMRLISTIGLDAEWIRTGQINTNLITVGERTLTETLADLSQQISSVQGGGTNLFANANFGTQDNPSNYWWADGPAAYHVDARNIKASALDAANVTAAEFDAYDF